MATAFSPMETASVPTEILYLPVVPPTPITTEPSPDDFAGLPIATTPLSTASASSPITTAFCPALTSLPIATAFEPKEPEALNLPSRTLLLFSRNTP